MRASTKLRGLPVPQQARSRAALKKILASAEQVLARSGVDGFTMQTVAEQAGVSIGALYRRFPGREELLAAVKDRIMTDLEQRLELAIEKARSESLSAVLSAYTRALADAFEPNGHVLSAILSQQGREAVARGRKSLRKLEALLLEGALPHVKDIGHPRPSEALHFIAQTILNASVNKMVSAPVFPEALSWPEWAKEMAEMTEMHLRSPRRGSKRKH